MGYGNGQLQDHKEQCEWIIMRAFELSGNLYRSVKIRYCQVWKFR